MYESYNIKTADDIDGLRSPFDNNFFTGHEQEAALLCSLVNHNRQHHALIFEGEQGLGKASLALHFAYSLFSYKKSGQPFNIQTPDENSAIWRQMGQNIYPGFLYLTRSYDSNAKRFKNYIAAEEIKQIGRMLQHSVSDSGRRIIIIDNVGDLNQYSANALLKMLEEPPANTLFILISHSQPVLATLRSRCLTIRFKSLALAQVHAALQHCLLNATMIDNAIIAQASGNVRKAAKLSLANITKTFDKLDELLREKQLNISLIQQIAFDLTVKDQPLAYQQCMENLLHQIAERAKEKAKAQELQQAHELYFIWRSMYEAFNATNLYNLNKKQLLCDSIIRTFNVMQDR